MLQRVEAQCRNVQTLCAAATLLPWDKRRVPTGALSAALLSTFLSRSAEQCRWTVCKITLCFRVQQSKLFQSVAAALSVSAPTLPLNYQSSPSTCLVGSFLVCSPTWPPFPSQVPTLPCKSSPPIWWEAYSLSALPSLLPKTQPSTWRPHPSQTQPQTPATSCQHTSHQRTPLLMSLFCASTQYL